MQLPLQIIQVGSEKVNRTELTRDISSGGVCFLSSEEVEVGGRIEYLITLSGSKPAELFPAIMVIGLAVTTLSRLPPALPLGGAGPHNNRTTPQSQRPM